MSSLFIYDHLQEEYVWQNYLDFDQDVYILLPECFYLEDKDLQLLNKELK